MKKLKLVAEELVEKSITEKDAEEIVKVILPVNNEMNSKEKQNIIYLQQDVLFRYKKAPDLEKFRGTAWGLINAVADHVTHREPLRKHKSFKERHFEKIINGNNLLNKAYELLKAA